MKRFRIAVVVALGLASVRPLSAHPLHASFTEITRAPNGTISLSVRLFADDFGALLESLKATGAGRTLEAVARSYALRAVQITTPDGRIVPTEWCGMRAADDLVWVCLRSTAPVRGTFFISNAMMFERFRDQTSIVRWVGKETRTLVLSARVRLGRLD